MFLKIQVFGDVTPCRVVAFMGIVVV